MQRSRILILLVLLLAVLNGVLIYLHFFTNRSGGRDRGDSMHSWLDKNLGLTEERRFHPRHESLAAAGIGAATGFYNGLIGPGTGTLMVFAFVSFLGLDFLKSSAVSKATNVAADISSWTVLFFSGFILWVLAVPLIIGNMIGSYIGSHLAIRKGQGFIRMVFLVIVLGLIARQAWQLLTH